MNGDTEAAILHYEAFVRDWRDADPELQVEVAEARVKLDALLAGLGREPSE